MVDRDGETLPAVRGRLLTTGKQAVMYPGALPRDPARVLSPARAGAETWLDADYGLMSFRPRQNGPAPRHGPAPYPAGPRRRIPDRGPAVILSPATPDDAAPLARILGDWLRDAGWIPVLHDRAEDLGFVARMIDSHTRSGRPRPGPDRLSSRSNKATSQASTSPPTHRGKGIGKALLDAAKTDEPRLALWTFQANTRAIAFYQREGFAELERTDGIGNEENLPDVRMIWRRDA